MHQHLFYRVVSPNFGHPVWGGGSNDPTPRIYHVCKERGLNINMYLNYMRAIFLHYLYLSHSK